MILDTPEKIENFRFFLAQRPPLAASEFPIQLPSENPCFRPIFQRRFYFLIKKIFPVRAPTYSDPEFDAEFDFDNHFDPKILKKCNAQKFMILGEEERETPAKTTSNSDLRFS